jgi:ATP-dependent DNA helicase RecG
MNVNEIKQLIEAGENSHIEFRSASFRNESLAKEVVAFANMKGGVVFIGITDTGELQSIEKGTEERVVNICRNTILPPIIPEIDTIVVNGTRILRIQIDAGKHKPYKLKTNNRFYIRAGSVSIEPTNEELVRLFQDGEQYHFEVSSLFAYDRNTLDILRFREYIERYRELEYENDELEKLLYNLQCIDGNQRVTVLGALFFANDPTRHLPQAGIEMNYFAGDDGSSEIADYQVEQGTVVQNIEFALAFVKKHRIVKALFPDDSGRRVEAPNYDLNVVRELIVNAFMHRDWSIFGQRIRLNLYANRLEVFSPGKLPNTLKLDSALAGISYYRNPIISQMLKDYRLADRVGRGLQKVVNYYKERQARLPEFDVSCDHVKVTLWAL